MKIRIALKDDPDGFYDSVIAEAKRLNISTDQAWDILDKWVLYAEYITLEFDLETKEARVVEVRE